MAGASDVLACQRQLADLVGRMLALARDSQFRPLPQLDAQCVDLVARLREMEPSNPSAGERALIADLLGRIDKDQAELNDLVRPHFISLMARMGEQRRPRDRMRGRNQPTHDPEKCPPGGARSSARGHPH